MKTISSSRPLTITHFLVVLHVLRVWAVAVAIKMQPQQQPRERFHQDPPEFHPQE